MENKSILTAVVILGIVLVLGFIVTLMSLPEPPKIPKCPDCNLTCPEPVIQEKEVIKEVEVAPDYKQKVVNALLEDIKNNSDYRYCDDEKYKASEIKVKRIYNGFTLSENSDGDTEISDVQIKLSYDDGKCYRTLTCGLDEENELSCE